MAITIYTKNDCIKCEDTKTMFDEGNKDYIVINMDENPAARKTVKAMNYKQAPVVVTEENKWSGWRPDLIKECIEGGSIWD